MYCSVGTAAFALVYGFEQNVCAATLACLACILLVFCGFKIETYIKANGNEILNRIIYLLTKNEKKYNVLHKHIIYSYLGNDQYTFEKKYEISPMVRDLDRVNDRFSWSVSSAGCDIMATNAGHTINKVWQQEMWTCYTIYLNEIPVKCKPYNVGSLISNLVDTTHSVVPYLSNTVDKKTKCTTLVVKFPKDDHPELAKFEVFSSKAGMDSNYEENLAYDDGVGGFTRTVRYPRKGWRYVISWEK